MSNQQQPPYPPQGPYGPPQGAYGPPQGFQPPPPPRKVKPALFRRGWMIALIAFVALLVGVGIGSSSSSDKATVTTASSNPTATVTVTAKASATADGNKPAPTVTVTSTVTAKAAAAAAPATKPAPAAGHQVDGDWEMVSVKIGDDGLGDFGGTARVKYNGDDPSAEGVFEVTLLNGTDVIGTLTGSANEVEPGKTVTVDLVSSDSFKKGPWKIDFQKSF